MTKEMMKLVREFAEINWGKDEADQIYGDDEEFAVSNPWMDHSGRFELDDIGAVKECGLDVVMDFCEKAIKEINKEKEEKDPVLCGFVWCHGKKDFSAYEIELKQEDRDAIEEILAKYETDGTSERNVWERKFSDVFCEEY